MEPLVLAYTLCGGGGGGTSRSLTAGDHGERCYAFEAASGLTLRLTERKKNPLPLISELTDTSRGADSLVRLVAIPNRVVSQKLDVVLLPGVYIERKKNQKQHLLRLIFAGTLHSMFENAAVN